MTQSEIMVQMKKTVEIKYGKDSFEAGYLQHVFTRRSTEMFYKVYRDLIDNNEKRSRRQ